MSVPPPNERLLLLDMDGTMVDSLEDLGRAFNQLLKENGRPALSNEALREQITFGSRVLLPKYLEVEPESPRLLDLRDRYFSLYEEHGFPSTRLMAGMEKVITKAEAMGLPWGVATNRFRRLVPALIEKLGLSPACLLCADDVDQSKPAPDMIVEALRQTGTNADNCLYVGDHDIDRQAAHGCGTSFAAAQWGYSVETIVRESCDIWLESPTDLYNWMDNARLG